MEKKEHPPPPTISYANTVWKRFQALVLDISCASESEITSSEGVAQFIFTDLALKREEIMRVKGVGSVAKPIVVVTKKAVIISKRFGEKVEFKRSIKGKMWTCAIRGGSRDSTLRYFQVPEEVCNADFVDAISPFAVPKSDIIEDVFGKDSPLWGLGTGNVRVPIQVNGEIPEFIQIRKWKIRISHPSQIKKCYLCNETDHIKAFCPKGLLSETNELEAEIVVDSLVQNPVVKPNNQIGQTVAGDPPSVSENETPGKDLTETGLLVPTGPVVFEENGKDTAQDAEVLPHELQEERPNIHVKGKSTLQEKQISMEPDETKPERPKIPDQKRFEQGARKTTMNTTSQAGVVST